MIFPFEVVIKHNGNIKFLGNHIPNSKKQLIDRICDCWKTEYEFDPLSEIIISSSCSCPDCKITRSKCPNYNCKHIIEDLNYLKIVLNLK